LIKVLVVEDSPVVREFLVHILESDPGIRVVGTAHNGEQALEAIARSRPDVVTMDVHMPKMNGLDATRRIMETCPTPIVVVSGSTEPGVVATTFEAMDAGALAVLRRPAGLGHPEHETTARELVETVKLMSEVKVVRRWASARRETNARPQSPVAERLPRSCRIVAIGASTGGPPVLQTILSQLPADFPVPILIVQHMAAGFVRGFVDWLAHSSRLPVHVAVHGERLQAGHVYVAGDDLHMKAGRDGRIMLTPEPPENGLRPSVSCLFRSVAEVYGGDTVAGLLTGMGRDGAEELKLLRDKGAITFAQDQASAVVHGMPGEAIRLDAASFVLSPERIAAVLAKLANGVS
jgi:two-component system chemotaxis response regulator CheB